MAFFIGEYDYTIDNKGRINIPAKFRKAMSPSARNTFIITQGTDRCLDVYPLDVFEKKIVQKINEFSESNKSHRFYTSLKGSNSTDSVLDKQGRITVPPKLCKYAGIDKEVKIIGAFNRIELWDPKIREAYLKESSQSYENIDEELMP